MEKETGAAVEEETPEPSLRKANAPNRLIDWYRKHKRLALAIGAMILLLPLLGLLALRNAHAQWTSPIVYPSRKYCQRYI